MPIHNTDISRIFNRVADLLEISDANPFRVRAYRNAARTVDDQPQSMVTMLREGEDLSELSGIGEDLAEKIAEIVESGTLQLLEDLQRKVPGELPELLRIAQLGPKKVAALHKELGIETLDELGEAARQKKVRDLEGFGKKTEQKILRELERHAKFEARTMLPQAAELVGPLVEYLGSVEGVWQVEVAGSFRRRKETVGDLDILVSCKDDSPVMDRFAEYEDVSEVLAKGGTKSTVRLRGGLQVDLRVVPRQSYGAALYYFTGSKEHNIAVRQIAIDQGLKLNEYGVFRGEDEEGERIAGADEEEVFRAVGLPFIAPELRENRGEIEAARQGTLPDLVDIEAIRGDLHSHTRATDGRASLEDMVEAAAGLGYSYLAITEHSQAVTVARGLDPGRLEKQIEQIDKLNEAYPNFRIFKGIEVDILEDGSLDLPDAVLGKLDLTVCSVHSKFDLSAEKQTERIIRAMDNPHFNILGHPTGRLINERDPYRLDMDKIMEAARQRGCFLELNSHPERLDLNDHHCRMAREAGVKVAICTDAHSTQGLKNMKYGINQARRGWLSAEDVINTRSAADLLKLLRR